MLSLPQKWKAKNVFHFKTSSSSRAGFNYRGPRLINLRGPLSHCYEKKNGKALINLRKVENDDIDL